MIGVCFIVKNEAPHFRAVLESCSDFDEIVVADTGSTDETVSIAREFTENVYHFDWCDDFSAARNFAVSKIKSEYCLTLDGDEVIEEINMPEIMDIISKHPIILGRITVKNVTENSRNTSAKLRRFFSTRHFSYKGRIHEQLTPDTASFATADIPIVAANSGNRRDILDEKKKCEYYAKLLKLQLEEEGESDYIYYQLGQTSFISKDYPAALAYYDRALELCVSYAPGKPILEWQVFLITQRVYSLIEAGRGEDALFAVDYFEYLKDYSDYLFALGYACANVGMFAEAVTFYLDAKDAPRTLVEGTNSYNADKNIRIIHEQLGTIQQP